MLFFKYPCPKRTNSLEVTVAMIASHICRSALKEGREHFSSPDGEPVEEGTYA